MEESKKDKRNRGEIELKIREWGWKRTKRGKKERQKALTQGDGRENGLNVQGGKQASACRVPGRRTSLKRIRCKRRSLPDFGGLYHIH